MEESGTGAYCNNSTYFNSAKGAIQLTVAATEARLLGTQLGSQAVNDHDSLE